MAQGLIVKTEIGSAFFLWQLESKRAGADGDPVAVFQLVLEFLFAIYVDFVRAAPELPAGEDTIDDHERSIVTQFDMRVMSRRARIIEHDLVVGRAAN